MFLVGPKDLSLFDRLPCAAIEERFFVVRRCGLLRMTTRQGGVRDDNVKALAY
jgi:hypothetical protein